MNVLANISALIATLWLSVFCFDTLGNAYLGTAFVVLFFFVIVSTVFAVQYDLEDFRER